VTATWAARAAFVSVTLDGTIARSFAIVTAKLSAYVVHVGLVRGRWDCRSSERLLSRADASVKAL
jgi:hypothetical protein